MSDGGIWSKTGICKRLKGNKLNIPSPRKHTATDDIYPYVFIGDEAFPLMDNLMKPYRLCRARRIVENVFGILASRFRVFLQPIAVAVERVDAIVLASCTLHNFLRKNSKKQYIVETLC